MTSMRIKIGPFVMRETIYWTTFMSIWELFKQILNSRGKLIASVQKAGIKSRANRRPIERKHAGYGFLL